MSNTYLDPKFLPHINKSLISTIIECGGANGKDTPSLQQYYDAIIYTFECDPTLLPALNKVATKNIHVVPLALWSSECSREFLYVDRNISINKTVGISSMFEWSDLGGMRKQYPSNYLVQIPISVKCTTIDKFCTENNIIVNMLCLDTQGSELEILKGATQTLECVSHIITEVNYTPQYNGSCSFQEVRSFLEQKNFNIIVNIADSRYFGNAIFIKKG